MTGNPAHSNSNRGWQALLALLAVEGIEALLSDQLSLRYLLPGSSAAEWVELGISLALFLAAALSWALGRRAWTRAWTLAFSGWITLGLATDVFALVLTMPERMNSAGGLRVLSDAILVWSANILVFAIWYWLLENELPPGGRRHLAFPQQTNELPGWEHWQPGFMDYLFLAFNTSTAFSPTDTLVLSPIAKALTMIQATLSLLILAVLAAFGVNILAN